VKMKTAEEFFTEKLGPGWKVGFENKDFFSEQTGLPWKMITAGRYYEILMEYVKSVEVVYEAAERPQDIQPPEALLKGIDLMRRRFYFPELEGEDSFDRKAFQRLRKVYEALIQRGVQKQIDIVERVSPEEIQRFDNSVIQFQAKVAEQMTRDRQKAERFEEVRE